MKMNKIIFYMTLAQIFTSSIAYADCDAEFMEQAMADHSVMSEDKIALSTLFIVGLSPNPALAAALSTGGVLGPGYTTKKIVEKNAVEPSELLKQARLGQGEILEKFYHEVDPQAPKDIIRKKLLEFNQLNIFCSGYNYTVDEMAELIRGEI